MEGEALLVGSLFNFHGGKPSCMTGCLLLGNPNSRGGAKEVLLKLFLESRTQAGFGRAGETQKRGEG